MTYFDNAATSFPKPRQVVSAVSEALVKYGANPGRAGHTMAYETAEKIYETRKLLAQFFGTENPENVVFTHNCTQSLNFVIKGLAKKGAHFICSDIEHNAVLRPLESLYKQGVITYSLAKTTTDDETTVESFEKLINENTVAIVCTGASNVFGKMLPFRKIADMAHRYGVLTVLDAAQTAGIINIDCDSAGIDYLCVAGHKGLYAPMGTGVLICNCSQPLETIIEGGTGSFSQMLSQPSDLPDRFESGTLSVPDILGLKSGLEYVKGIGTEKIYAHESNTVKHIYNSLHDIKNVKLYTDLNSTTERFLPVLSFNIDGLHSEETGSLLSDMGIAVRAGFHCAGAAHKKYGTIETGTVRIAPSVFTTKNDVNLLLNSVFQIAKQR